MTELEYEILGIVRPASLPPIDEVEVVDLAGLNINAGSFVTDAAGAPSVRVGGSTAQRIAELWRSRSRCGVTCRPSACASIRPAT